MTKIDVVIDIILLFIIFIVSLFWFWYLYPYKPLEITSPLKVLNENKTVEAGDLLYFQADFVKNTDISPVLQKRLVDGIVYSLPSTIPHNKTGDSSKIVVNDIPRSIPPNLYKMEFTACYQMNPIREVCVDYETEKFIVTKAE